MHHYCHHCQVTAITRHGSKGDPVLPTATTPVGGGSMAVAPRKGRSVTCDGDGRDPRSAASMSDLRSRALFVIGDGPGTTATGNTPPPTLRAATSVKAGDPRIPPAQFVRDSGLARRDRR
jgi:hypothetical protein